MADWSIGQLEADRSEVSRLTSQFYMDNRLSWRVKTIVQMNPYMANKPEAVMSMAQMPIEDNELFTNAGAMFGIKTSETIAETIKRYPPSMQRTIFATLTPAQQASLKQLGFEPERADVDEEGFFENILGTAFKPIGAGLSFVTRGIGPKVMPVVGPALNLMDELSDFVVGRPYRTIRQLGTDGQLAALIGGVVSVGAVLAAVPTGGASLALLGAAGVAGATAASAVEQAFVGNADDWWNAWSKAGNGEKLFYNSGVRKATEILGDSRLVNVAKNVASILGPDVSLVDLAQDFAGTEGSVNASVQQEQLSKLAETYAEPNTPQFQKVFKGLSELVASPLFQDAVKALEQSKISMGRDVANLLSLDPESSAHRWISGSVDAASLLILDPFLIIGKTARVASMSKRGIHNVDAAAAAARYRKIAERPEMVRLHTVVADSINSGSTELMRRYAPHMLPVWNELLAHSRNPFMVEQAARTGKAFGADDVVDWIIGPNQLKSIMQGAGVVQGTSYGMLKGINRTQYALRSAKGALADFMKAASDVKLESVVKRLAKDPDALKQLIDGLPEEWAVHLAGVTPQDLPGLLAKLGDDGAAAELARVTRESAGLSTTAYEAGRIFANVPGMKTIGTLYDNLATLSPRGGLIAVDPRKAESVTDIDAFIDLFKVAGVPSYVREIWKRSIYQAPDVGARINGLASMIDSMATSTGIRATASGADMLDDVLYRFRQEYALGSTGRFDYGDILDLPVAALPEADTALLMQIPDLKTMRQAVRQGTLLRALVGVSDKLAIEAFQNRFWKPAVLLRFGFLVRNATEDMLAFLARAGVGHLSQSFAARSIGQETVYKEGLQAYARSAVATLEKPVKDGMVKNFAVPAHVRPVARIIDRFGKDGSPAVVALENYGYWLRNKLRFGLTGDVAKQSLFDPLTDPNAWAGIPKNIQRNIRANLDSIVLGNPYSFRRMARGGVNKELIASAEAFQRKFLASIMERVGASSSLPWEQVLTGDESLLRTITLPGNKTVHVRVNGERTFTSLGINDSMIEEFHEAVYKNVNRLTDDGPARVMLMEVAKVYTPDIAASLNEDDLFTVLDNWFNVYDETRQVANRIPSQNLTHFALIALEPNQTPERLRGFLKNADFGFGETANAAGNPDDAFRNLFNQRFGGDYIPTPQEVVLLIADAASQTGQQVPFSNALIKLIDSISGATTDVSRKWLLGNLQLDFTTKGAHLDQQQIRDWYFTLKSGSPDAQISADQLSPFYSSLNDALSGGEIAFTDQINRGLWEDVFSLNRDYLPGTWGRPYFVIKQPVASSGRLTDDMLLAENLVDINGATNLDTMAFTLDVDLTRLTPQEVTEFKTFADSYIDSLRTGKPFFVSNERAGELLRDKMQFLHFRNFRNKSPILAKSWIPVNEGVSPATAYPELADRIGSFSSQADDIGVVSTISWDQNIYPTPDVFNAEASRLTTPESIVKRLRDTVEQRVRGGRRTKMQLRNDAVLYMRSGDDIIQVPPGTIIDRSVDLYTDKKLRKRVDIRNKRYFKSTDVIYEGNEEVMWGMIGPVLVDMAEEMGSRTVKTVKTWTKKGASKYTDEILASSGGAGPEHLFDAVGMKIPEDVVRLRSSTVDDVIGTPKEHLPNFEIAQVFEPVYKNGWDQFVSFGFDKVFSPALNAMTRRPMAFHSFNNAFSRNIKATSWLYKGGESEKELNNLIDRLVREDAIVSQTPLWFGRTGEAGKMLGEVHGVDSARYWNDSQAIAYLASFNDTEFAEFSTQIAQALNEGRLALPANQVKALDQYIQANKYTVRNIVLSDIERDSWDFIDQFDSIMGEGSAVAGRRLDFSQPRRQMQRQQGVWQTSEADDLARQLKPEDWKTIQNAAKARERAFEDAGGYAAEYAIRDIMPYIDTSEVRSQFSDWARGFLPFWYAEENFLKRWARIFSLDGPAGTLMRARQLQLTANGLKTMGIVRTDTQGNSYFVYPGSDLLIDVVENVFPGQMVPIQAMLQTPVERMIPGFNPNFGAPGFSPLVSLPVEIGTFLFPEAPIVRDFQRDVFGDLAANQDIVSMIFPAAVSNTVRALYEYSKPYESTPNERMMSAMFSAMANLSASGNGLPDNATANERDIFIRRIRNHARIINVAQALAGWFTPGPAQSLQVQEDQSSLSWLTDGQVVDAQNVLFSVYLDLVKNLGIEDGTAEYLARFPDHTIKEFLGPSYETTYEEFEGIAEPMAFTVSKTRSVSGAPLPMAEDGIRFYMQNKNFFEQYEYAGPWMLPQDGAVIDERSQYAYDNALIEGLRTQRTTDEFLDQLKFREASGIYFNARKSVVDEQERLRAIKDTAGVRALENRWETFSATYKALHPIFAEMLTGADSRQRRQRVIDEMRYFLGDPEAPKSSHFDSMKILMDSFDMFTRERSRLNLNSSAQGRTFAELYKKRFEEWTTAYILENPQVKSFWITVLRPESGLD